MSSPKKIAGGLLLIVGSVLFLCWLIAPGIFGDKSSPDPSPPIAISPPPAPPQPPPVIPGPIVPLVAPPPPPPRDFGEVAAKSKPFPVARCLDDEKPFAGDITRLKWCTGCGSGHLSSRGYVLLGCDPEECTPEKCED